MSASCVVLRVMRVEQETDSVKALSQFMAVSSTARLCDLNTTLLNRLTEAAYVVGISEAMLYTLDNTQEEYLCQKCLVRLSILAANDLQFVSADLIKMIELLA